MVIKSPPTILKIASVKLPDVCAGAVIVLLLPVMVIVFVAVPVAVMLYPPAGAVCGFDAVRDIVTGAVMVAPFNAVIAADKLG
jgi:hypothetical protein